jgi:uncharacterized OsmC-like protein
MPPLNQKQERIKTAFERNGRAMELRPGVAQGTARTKVTLREGMTCDVEDGPWKMVVDMGEKSGGDNKGPNPGVLGRGALGTCLAVGYMMWASKLGVPINGLTVEIEADYDSRGYHGVGDVKPGYTAIRYKVTVESDAPEAEVEAMLDTADKYSDYLAVFRDPQEVTRETRILAPQG